MKVVLLDAYNLIHRARSGFTKGDYSIIYNFFRGIRPLIEKFNPDKVYFVLEGYPKFRVELDAHYKGDRKRHDDSFRQQKDIIIDLVKRCMPFVAVRHPDFECDDVIATLVSQHSKLGDKCVIISSDSDFIQLHNVFDIELYNPIRKMFVPKPPHDYVAWKALRGDKTDNIAGIRGIGDKTANKLMANPSLLKELLSDHAKHAIFEKNVNLIRLVDLSSRLEELEINSGVNDMEALRETFVSFDFISMVNDKPWKKFVRTFENLQVS